MLCGRDGIRFIRCADLGDINIGTKIIRKIIGSQEDDGIVMLQTRCRGSGEGFDDFV